MALGGKTTTLKFKKKFNVNLIENKMVKYRLFNKVYALEMERIQNKCGKIKEIPAHNTQSTITFTHSGLAGICTRM
jgi:hypothetical protein